MERIIFLEQRPAWGRTCHGCFFGIACERPERASHEEKQILRDCRCLRFLSGVDAYDRMDLRSHNRRVFPCIRKIYPMDCPDSSCLYRWKDGG